MIRPALPEELDYCRATWLVGMLRGRRLMKHRRQRIRTVIDVLLESERVWVDVAPGETPDEPTILGWCCVTPLASTSVVHYCYTRTEHQGVLLRRRGIARALLAAAGVDFTALVPYTHSTGMLPALLRASGVAATPLSVEQVIECE